MGNPPHIIFIAEFRGRSVATGALADELLDHLTDKLAAKVSYVHTHQKYRPGGLRPMRLLGFAGLHLALPFILLFHKLCGLLTGAQQIAIATTSPPLLQWSVTFWAKLLRMHVLVWYQDAHPEIEARFFTRKHLGWAAGLLRALDKWFLTQADSIVTLDNAMRDLIAERIPPEKSIPVIPPWATYMGPGKPLQLPASTDVLRLLYAGNYGVAHDLEMMAKALSQLPEAEQKKIHLSFVGMNDTAAGVLKDLFRTTHCPLAFLPRFESLDDLLACMRTFHFGIVSQRDAYAGLVAPSKSYTYLSQGLPLLYLGPSGTFPAELVELGWGCLGNEEFFTNWLEIAAQQCQRHVGEVFADPKPAALQNFELIIRGMLATPANQALHIRQ